MESCRTIRVDLTESVTQEVVVEWLKSHGVARALVCRELGDETGKPHLQGWLQLPEGVSDASWKQKVARWKKSLGLGKTQASSAVLRKEEYFSYVLKDGVLVWSTGVSEDEIREWSQKAFKKSEKYKPLKICVYDVFVNQGRTGPKTPSRREICTAVVQHALDTQSGIYRNTVVAQTESIWLRLRGPVGVRAFVEELFPFDTYK